MINDIDEVPDLEEFDDKDLMRFLNDRNCVFRFGRLLYAKKINSNLISKLYCTRAGWQIIQQGHCLDI
jgi:hypothetical protein